MPRTNRVVSVGSPAPPLVGPAVGGEPFDLAAPRSGPLLVEFHRGTW